MSDTEIRPDTIDADDLATVKGALTRSEGEMGSLVDSDGRPIRLPVQLRDALLAIVENLGAGNGVAVAALHTELSTFEAAELLNVSRPHLIKLCETGVIAFHKTGSHRRLRLTDVLAYRDQQADEARRALQELVDDAEEHALYDEA